MTKEEANELYEKFKVTGREAFSLHEIWLMIFWNGKNQENLTNKIPNIKGHERRMKDGWHN